MHGGIPDPDFNGNTALPVQSKYVAKDKLPAILDKNHADRLFGFRSQNDKNQSKERRINFIDRDSKKALINKLPPDIIY